MIESLLSAMALSLLLTLGLELVAYGMLGVRGGRNYLLCLLVNLLTNPAVVLLHRLASLRVSRPPLGRHVVAGKPWPWPWRDSA